MQQRCERCGAAYDFLSRGTWPCVHHPQGLDYSGRRYTCCGRARGAAGCQRCDHGPNYGRVPAVEHFRAVMIQGKAIDASAPGLCATAWVIKWCPNS